MKETTPGKPGSYVMPETFVTAKQPTLRQGARGENVKIIQTKVGVKSDGIWGPATTAAVKAFQASHGLSPDGAVGPKTWEAMGY
jgi:peptidoglycan hydrolase-like protein with peptidoglycan-binding domain